jgi:hypothetical protein
VNFIVFFCESRYFRRVAPLSRAIESRVAPSSREWRHRVASISIEPLRYSYEYIMGSQAEANTNRAEFFSQIWWGHIDSVIVHYVETTNEWNIGVMTSQESDSCTGAFKILSLFHDVSGQLWKVSHGYICKEFFLRRYFEKNFLRYSYRIFFVLCYYCLFVKFICS